MIKKRFKVIEYSSYYSVQEVETGKEHPMSDGVGAVFNKDGKAMRPGTEKFCLTWERILNENAYETGMAYFGH